MDKATKSKFRISRSGRLGAAGPQFYDVGTIFNFLKIYADAEGDYPAYLERAISSGSTFVRPEDSGQLLEFLQVYMVIYYFFGYFVDYQGMCLANKNLAPANLT